MSLPCVGLAFGDWYLSVLAYVNHTLCPQFPGAYKFATWDILISLFEFVQNEIYKNLQLNFLKFDQMTVYVTFPYAHMYQFFFTENNCQTSNFVNPTNEPSI